MMANSDLVTEIKPRALRNSMNIMITHYYIALMSHLQQQYDTQKIKHKCQVLFSKIFRQPRKKNLKTITIYIVFSKIRHLLTTGFCTKYCISSNEADINMDAMTKCLHDN